MAIDELDAMLASRLRSVNQRVTSNRAAVVAVLARAGRPLTIHEILEHRSDLAQSSVYRSLVVLEQAGVVRRIVTNDEFHRFELAEDLTEHHHHLICTQCGGVEDVPATRGLERSVASAISAIDRATGFATEHHRLDLVGTCRACR